MIIEIFRFDMLFEACARNHRSTGWTQNIVMCLADSSLADNVSSADNASLADDASLADNGSLTDDASLADDAS